eukprot:scaffold40405_cov67-Phaeocystis_antarctica.AAC.4
MSSASASASASVLACGAVLCRASSASMRGRLKRRATRSALWLCRLAARGEAPPKSSACREARAKACYTCNMHVHVHVHVHVNVHVNVHVHVHACCAWPRAAGRALHPHARGACSVLAPHLCVDTHKHTDVKAPAQAARRCAPPQCAVARSRSRTCAHRRARLQRASTRSGLGAGLGLGPEPRGEVRVGATGLGVKCDAGSGRAVAQQRRRHLRAPLTVRGEVERRRAVVRRGIAARAAREQRGDHLERRVARREVQRRRAISRAAEVDRGATVEERQRGGGPAVLTCEEERRPAMAW